MGTGNKKQRWIVGALLGLLFVVVVAVSCGGGGEDKAIHVPADLAGVNAAEAGKRLRSLGFSVVNYVSDTGSAVIVKDNWTVVSVDDAGTVQDRDRAVVVRVARAVPPSVPTTLPMPLPTTQSVPAGTTTAAVPPVQQAPEPAPTPVQPAPQTPAPVYYGNCAEAKAAGAAPLRRGDPGYRAGLDRDGDGVACE